MKGWGKRLLGGLSGDLPRAGGREGDSLEDPSENTPEIKYV